VKDRYLHTEQHKHRINANNTEIYVLSWIRTHDLNVGAGEDGSCLRQRGHCDRQLEDLYPLETEENLRVHSAWIPYMP
jgi:hypothetical protein